MDSNTVQMFIEKEATVIEGKERKSVFYDIRLKIMQMNSSITPLYHNKATISHVISHGSGHKLT